MTKKKVAQVKKLDKRTLFTEDFMDIKSYCNMSKFLLSTTVKTKIQSAHTIVDKLDYSGHKELADTVIRLQRNTDYAIMLAEMLGDVLLCIYEESCAMQRGLAYEDLQKRQSEIVNNQDNG